MILLIANFREDPTVLRLRKVLQIQGTEGLIISFETLQEPSSFFVGNSAGGEQGAQTILHLPDRTVDLGSVTSVFLWRGWTPDRYIERFQDLFEKKRDEWDFFERQWSSFHKGFAMTLALHQHLFCVNPPPWNTAFEEKCCQLAIAADVGLRIPPTLYPTHISLVREFYEEHNESIIYKPLRSLIRFTTNRENQTTSIQTLFTNRVKLEDLEETGELLPAPGIFQPYIDKQIELRIVVIGKKLLTCAIHSQNSERDRDDWRHYDLENTAYGSNRYVRTSL